MTSGRGSGSISVGKYTNLHIQPSHTYCEAACAYILNFILRDTVLSPRNAWVRIWEFVIFAIIIWQALFVPFFESFRPELTKPWITLDSVMDCMFFADVVLRFSIAVPMNNLTKRHEQILRFNYSRLYIALDYLSCWFWIDSISCISFFLRYFSDQDSLSGVDPLKTVRLPRLFRLLRLMRFTKSSNSQRKNNWSNWIMYSRYANLWRLFSLIVSIFLATHFVACGMYAVATKDNFDGIKSDDVFHQYVGAYYCALLLLMGESLSMETVEEQIFAIFTTVLGAVSMAVIFGNVALVVDNFSANGTKYQKKKESLFEAM